jgi:hypothetical protein
MRTAQGLMLSRMYPFNINSSTCHWSSLDSLGLLLYIGLFGIDAPGIKSIGCSIPLIYDKTPGISSGKTSLNSCKRTLTTLGAHESILSELKYTFLYTSKIIGNSER